MKRSTIHGKESERNPKGNRIRGTSWRTKSSHVTADELRKIVPGIPGKRLLRMLGPLNQAIELSGCTTEERSDVHRPTGKWWFQVHARALVLRPISTSTNRVPKKGEKKSLGIPAWRRPRYKGRSFIQITGRSNYEKAGKALGIDLVIIRKKAEDPEVAASGLVLAHPHRRQRKGTRDKNAITLNDLADKGDFVGVTRGVNGGTNGLRIGKRITRAKAEFHEHPEEPRRRYVQSNRQSRRSVVPLSEAGAGSVLNIVPVTMRDSRNARRLDGRAGRLLTDCLGYALERLRCRVRCRFAF